MTKRVATTVVTAGRRAEWTGRIVNPPIHRASTMLFDDCAALEKAGRQNADGQYYYGRRGTPTQWALAEALTALEPGAAGTMLFPTGLAAISCALLSVLSAGGDLLVTDSVYEPVRRFCREILEPMGVTTRFYDPMVGAEIANMILPTTRAIFCESPGSLTFEVQDIPVITKVARSQGVVTLLDNTWATPILFPAIERGIDISILSCTKYVVGHSDAMLGSVSATAPHYERVRRTAQLFGQHVAPDEAYLTARGLRTLAVRLKAHQESALQIARWLEGRAEVARVLHPALESFPGHTLWKRDFLGSSGLFGVVLAGGTQAPGKVFVDSLRHFGIGYSWGGFESLALPVDPTTIRTATRWTDEGPLIRLQIGLEDPSDLIADLECALERFREACR